MLFFVNDTVLCSCEGTPEEERLRALHTFHIAKEWFADKLAHYE